METNKIYHGDALEVLKTFPDNSIDCVMTSPPYWALRDYSTEGQLGLEPTYQEHVSKMCDVFDEVKRVLKKEGTCWVNYGDTYIGSPPGNKFDGQKDKGDGLFSRLIIRNGIQNNNAKVIINNNPDPKLPERLRGREQVDKQDLQDKCLSLIPMRFAIEMVSRGWILRNDCVWYKRNSMPSSVKDRFANKWEHLFFFVKSKRYYFDLDSIRKPHLASSISRINAGFSDKVSFNYRVREAVKGTLEPNFGSRYTATAEEKVGYNEKYNQLNDKAYQKKVLGVPHDKANCNPKGGNPGDVLKIDEEPSDFWDITTQPHKFAHFACYPERLCEMPIKAGCPPGGIVLDPFMGSGTTALVALKQNKKFVGIELNESYIDIAMKRLKPWMNQTKL
ncbi:MAG: site-specific DNA-methyltransferase [Candidatus Daviesbacteria bacterium]|nr:site-specific DNA-methyltransferase [Candidatus Daviesbacteria bacterium]